jgi:hypothetical protein
MTGTAKSAEKSSCEKDTLENETYTSSVETSVSKIRRIDVVRTTPNYGLHGN